MSAAVQMAPVLPRLYGASEVAKSLGVSRSLIYKWIREGSLSFVRLGRRPMFDARDVAAFVEARRDDASRPVERLDAR